MQKKLFKIHWTLVLLGPGVEKIRTNDVRISNQYYDTAWPVSIQSRLSITDHPKIDVLGCSVTKGSNEQ